MNWRDQLREKVAPEYMSEPPGGFDPGPPDVIEQKREHEYREDMIKWERELKAQRLACKFCAVWMVSDVGMASAVTFNARFVDALKEEK